ncbi:unnamed protein product [Nesidiocoris tenuis]|uniref:Uncharacterized protein n=1 Tax=Nesidiocoris tenuis TaxID=355587 RepID=A0A6H5GSI4_9HEMI|nr:unnamed protein product [Nesidiocoris tenuis]
MEIRGFNSSPSIFENFCFPLIRSRGLRSSAVASFPVPRDAVADVRRLSPDELGDCPVIGEARSAEIDDFPTTTATTTSTTSTPLPPPPYRHLDHHHHLTAASTTTTTTTTLTTADLCSVSSFLPWMRSSISHILSN